MAQDLFLIVNKDINTIQGIILESFTSSEMGANVLNLIDEIHFYNPSLYLHLFSNNSCDWNIEYTVSSEGKVVQVLNIHTLKNGKKFQYCYIISGELISKFLKVA